mgnify:CR=1 FL=1
MSETSRYFLAIVPPAPVLSAVGDLKEQACQLFNSCAALRSPPHITLHMPFLWKDKKVEKLYQVLSEFSTDVSLLDIRLRKFGHFGERVIFLEPEANDGLLMLQKDLAKAARTQLNLLNAGYKDRGFHPHMTIAFRDLKKQVFQEAYQHFAQKKIDLQFQVQDFSLLKHDGKKWHDFQRFSFRRSLHL